MRSNKLISLCITSVFCCLYTLLIISCKKGESYGVMFDGDNDIKIEWHNMICTDAIKVMNGEIIHHNQIPLGESFTLINQGVEGLTIVKDSVSVGCELIINDTENKELLRTGDLFLNHPTYHSSELEFLRCEVSTGSPMKYDASYHVKVRYWDKYGNGELINEFTISIIDLP